ncbi:MAG: hypothetical protein HUJ11_04315 [Arenibacter algicola]|nr:hypothetical protein [Arenibacter algicola]
MATIIPERIDLRAGEKVLLIAKYDFIVRALQTHKHIFTVEMLRNDFEDIISSKEPVAMGRKL